MDGILTIPELVRLGASRYRGTAALLDGSGASWSYSSLAAIVAGNAAALRSIGIGRSDRVVLLVPNGPEAAVAFLSAASVGVAAPVNPDLGDLELARIIEELQPAAVVMGSCGPADHPRRRPPQGVPLVEFAAGGSLLFRDASDWPPGPQALDVGLILPTSGTTGRSKLVPITHESLYLSATNIARTLQLSETDRCLNVMPLFHIHGLVGAVLASLSAGGSVVCAPGFSPSAFLRTLRETTVTWYTAVPAIHQAVLAHHARCPESSAHALENLRFIRSSSAPMSAPLLRAMEESFGVPVIEAYGMTEAAHQIASNPLPPGQRRPGSVGPAAGPELSVLSPQGGPLPVGSTGEVAVRGPTLMSGYLETPGPGREAFPDGWFRTGDEGHLDADGYLFLTGRLDERINRGGEKISPTEVDLALLDHPGVAEAAAFAVPSERMGEEVGAAVVARPGGVLTEMELRQFVAARLSSFKIPALIRIVTEIPRGATGKVRRSALADQLGVAPLKLDLGSRKTGDQPETPRAEAVMTLWREILGDTPLAADDSFFAAGGDSFLAVNLVERASRQFGVDLSLASFSIDPTIRGMVAAIDRSPTRSPSSSGRGLVSIQRGTDPEPVFCVPGHDGSPFGFSLLARRLGPEPSLLGCSLPESGDSDIASTAALLVERVRAAGSKGPYRLIGLCFGALVAWEMARQIEKQGQRVSLLVLLDPPERPFAESGSVSRRMKSWASFLAARAAYHSRRLRDGAGWAYLLTRGQALLKALRERAQLGIGSLLLCLGVPSSPGGAPVARLRAGGRYRASPYAGPVEIWRMPARRPFLARWDALSGTARTHEVDFHPDGVIGQQNAELVAEEIRSVLTSTMPAEATGVPRVSVVMTAFNSEKYIEAAICSVLAQTEPRWELIVVDDGSTDGTEERVAACPDPRVRLLRTKNAGPAAASNEGVMAARGEYIGFLDADDLWRPEKLARHLAHFEASPHVDLTYSWSMWIDERGDQLHFRPLRQRARHEFQELLVDFVVGNTSAAVVRTEAVRTAGGFNLSLKRYYDFDLFLRIALLRPKNVDLVPADLTVYRRRPGQMSQDFEGMRLEWRRVLDLFEERSALVTPRVRALADSNMHRYFAFLAYEACNYRAGRSLLAHAARRGRARFAIDGRNWIVAAVLLLGPLMPAAGAGRSGSPSGRPSPG